MTVIPFRFNGFRAGFFEYVSSATPNYLTVNNVETHSKNNMGTVEIKSQDPFQIPLIQFQLFNEHDDDLSRMVQNLQYVRKLLNRKPLSKYIEEEVSPGSNVTSTADLEEHVRKNAWGHHGCCSAKMGSSADKMAVVDSKGRVRNIKNLRIIDISIFPIAMGWFPTLPIYLASEKLADDIATHYGR
ncbi:unnamed protein product [Didymodactylos carnosus]|nr:unnamed protein product [Didymodactylos carnosus]CAF4543977.1 unnamed protein product [Didymodactylos carnosus]